MREHAHKKDIILTVLMFGLLELNVDPAAALPQGEEVVYGQAQFERAGQTLLVTTSHKAIIQYDGFNVAEQESVRFQQPSSNSVTLNRVVGIDPSAIYGSLSANGQVFLVNPNGVFFGAHSRVDTAGLLVSTLNISDNDFLNRNYHFTSDPQELGGFIINQGNITVSPNGYVVLAAPFVSQEGLITANSGQIVLNGTKETTINFDSAGLINYVIGQTEFAEGPVAIPKQFVSELLQGLLGNEEIFSANEIVKDGEVFRLVYNDGAVAHSGITRADGTASENAGGVLFESDDFTFVSRHSFISANGDTHNSDGGEVKILSSMKDGRTFVDMDVDLQAKGGGISGDGGFIEVSAKDFWYFGRADASAAQGEVGTFLLDPDNITIVNGLGLNDAFLPIVDLADLLGLGASLGTTTLAGLNANVILQAENDITISNIVGNVLDFSNLDTESLIMQAGDNITFNDVNDLISTAGGDIHLEADCPHFSSGGDGTGTLTVGKLDSGGGAITLIGADFVLSGLIDADDGNISVAPSDGGVFALGSIAGNVLDDTELDRLSTTGLLTLGRATTQGTDGMGAGATTLTAGAITLDDLTLGSNDVALISADTINDDDDVGTSLAMTGNLVLSAINGIGTTSAFQTALTTLSAASTNGDIDIDNTSASDVILSSLSTGTGDLTFSQAGGGNILLGVLTASGNMIDISSTQKILDNNASALNLTADTLDLSAASFIGSKADPIEVASNAVSRSVTGVGGSYISNSTTGIIEYIEDGTLGTASSPLVIDSVGYSTLLLEAFGQAQGVSINIISGFLVSAVTLLNEPPGLALYNNTVLGGDNFASLATAQATPQNPDPFTSVWPFAATPAEASLIAPGDNIVQDLVFFFSTTQQLASLDDEETQAPGATVESEDSQTGEHEASSPELEEEEEEEGSRRRLFRGHGEYEEENAAFEALITNSGDGYVLGIDAEELAQTAYYNYHMFLALLPDTGQAYTKQSTSTTTGQTQLTVGHTWFGEQTLALGPAGLPVPATTSSRAASAQAEGDQTSSETYLDPSKGFFSFGESSQDTGSTSGHVNLSAVGEGSTGGAFGQGGVGGADVWDGNDGSLPTILSLTTNVSGEEAGLDLGLGQLNLEDPQQPPPPPPPPTSPPSSISSTPVLLSLCGVTVRVKYSDEQTVDAQSAQQKGELAFNVKHTAAYELESPEGDLYNIVIQNTAPEQEGEHKDTLSNKINCDGIELKSESDSPYLMHVARQEGLLKGGTDATLAGAGALRPPEGIFADTGGRIHLEVPGLKNFVSSDKSCERIDKNIAVTQYGQALNIPSLQPQQLSQYVSFLCR